MRRRPLYSMITSPDHNYTVMTAGLGDYHVAIYSKYIRADISRIMYDALCYLYSKRCYDAFAYCIKLACAEARRIGTARPYN